MTKEEAFEIRRALHAFSPFKVAVEAHAEEVYARECLVAKWGHLDNIPTSGVE